MPASVFANSSSAKTEEEMPIDRTTSKRISVGTLVSFFSLLYAAGILSRFQSS